MKINIKSINESPELKDGFRVLVDDSLPSGLDEYKVHADMWLRELTPSMHSREFLDEDFGNWYDYENYCITEMAHDKDLELELILEKARYGTVTLLYSKGDSAHNNAVIVRDAILASRDEFVPIWLEKYEKVPAMVEEDWQGALREAA